MLLPVKILVDSTAGISSELAQAWDIGLVPLYLIWDQQTYRDGIELLPTSFYSQLAESKTNPKTSAPSPADFIAAYRAVLAAGYQQILVVTVTPNMSATYANACIAAEDFSAETVVVLDSGQGAGAQALIAAYAAKLAREGYPFKEVVASAETASRHTEVYMAVNTLRYLHRSGRISRTQAMLGEFIQMKPILTFVDHKLQVVSKPRTMQRATDWLLKRLTQNVYLAEQVLVMYADMPKVAAEFAEQICNLLPSAEVNISPVSSVIGGHTGPGLIGLAVRWKDQSMKI